MMDLKRQSFELFLSLRVLCLLCLLPAIAACSTLHVLPLTPNIYSAATPYPANDIPLAEQGTTAKIFYITDRSVLPEEEKSKKDSDIMQYGHERSQSMAFGEATVTYGEDLLWDKLVELSQTGIKRPVIHMDITAVDELERFPATPLLFTATEEGIKIDAEQDRQYKTNIEAVKEAVRERLKSANEKDIIFYVHGFNNSFEDAVLGLNDVWHFSGRHGVPIAYSWPSGSGNLLGYFSDRESGEFTVYHLKETIRILSSMPEVENIHILAHSRGTDISTTALRELVIETRAAGKDPVKTLKIKNLILAAPDLDYGVVTQRLIAEKFGPAFGQITIYMNENDSALRISQLLMRGVRFGKLVVGYQNDLEAQIFKNIKNVTFINVVDVSGFIGHAYFSQHPGALSDIITLIKTNSRPGTDERPLTHIEDNFWGLDQSYLKPSPPDS